MAEKERAKSRLEIALLEKKAEIEKIKDVFVVRRGFTKLSDDGLKSEICQIGYRLQKPSDIEKLFTIDKSLQQIMFGDVFLDNKFDKKG